MNGSTVDRFTHRILPTAVRITEMATQPAPAGINIALVVSVEKMTHLPTVEVAAALGHASYQAEEGGLTFPQVFARFAQAYNQQYGDQAQALAAIAAKNHQNAMANPLAQLHKPLTVEFCSTISEKNPMVASPLKVTDCSLVSDGAAALVMVSDEIAQQLVRSVRFRAASHVSDYLPMSKRDLTAFEGPREAIRRAKQLGCVSNRDLHLAEVHDCFTIAELMIYEAMELTAPVGARKLLGMERFLRVARCRSTSRADWRPSVIPSEPLAYRCM